MVRFREQAEIAIQDKHFKLKLYGTIDEAAADEPQLFVELEHLETRAIYSSSFTASCQAYSNIRYRTNDCQDWELQKVCDIY